MRKKRVTRYRKELDMGDKDVFPEFIRSLPQIDLPLPGVTGWLVQGRDKQVVFVEFLEMVEVPDHAHEDQWELPVSGEVELPASSRLEAKGFLELPTRSRTAI